MTILRSDILTAVQSDKRINTSLDTTKFNEWMNDFDEESYNIKSAINPVQNSLSYDYTISTDPQTITLQTDFRDMNKKGLGLFIYENSTLSQKLNEISPSLVGKSIGFYWITDETIGLSGVSGRTVRHIYLPLLTRATSYDGTEEVHIEDRFREYAVSYIRKRYFTDIDEQIYLAMEMGYFADREAEFKSGTIKTPKTVKIPSVLNMY